MKENKPEYIDEHLLLQYLLGNLNDHERKVVEDWLHQSEENRKLLEKLEALWLETRKVSPAPVAVDTDAAWEKLSVKIREGEPGTGRQVLFRQNRVRRIILYSSAMAASFLILLGLYFLIWNEKLPADERLVDAQNRITPDTLPDGSVIVLNRQSRLTRPERFGSGNRVVRLSGEASFDIVHDPSRPFIIDCGRAMIRVLGTKFHVRAHPGQAIFVTVREGMILFYTLDEGTGDTNGIRLGRGMKGVLKKESGSPELMRGNPADDLQGNQEILSYDGTPLRTVLYDLSRIFATEIRVSDSSIYQCRLTASFEGEPVDQVLRIIAATFDLELVKQDETYILTGNGCKEKTR